MNERIVALDIGDARIGIAVSDASRLIASPVEVLHRKGWGPDVKRIAELCRQYDTTQVLSGLPLNMDGSAGFQTEKVRNFCEQLEKAGLTVYYQDERLTTVTAERALLEDNMHRADRKQNVDKVAAAIILQQYLDAMHEQERPQDEPPEDDELLEFENDDGSVSRYRRLARLEREGLIYDLLAEEDTRQPIAMQVETEQEYDEDGTLYEYETYQFVEDADLTQSLLSEAQIQ